MVTITRYRGPRYMTRFACLGTACEDTCCSTWKVYVDEPHYRAIEKRMASSDEERGRFRRSVLLVIAEERTPHRFAYMALGEDQRCTLLDQDRLCSLHRRYGEEILPTNCSMYPRSNGRIGDGAEQTAAVSCPEIARLCLLADDAVDLVPLAPELFTRPVIHRELADDAADPYDRSFERVRAAAVGLLNRPYPIGSRLHFLAHLADQTAAYLRRGGAFDGDHLDRTLATLEQTDTLDELHGAFSATEADDPFALGVVSQVLLSRRGRIPESFANLIETVLAGYPALSGDSAVDAPALWDEYRRRKAALPSALSPRIELYVRNFCINQLIKTWYVASPSFLGYVQAMLVHVAVLRFLLLGHPDTSATAEALDARAVDVFYKFGRAVLHDEKLTDRIVAALESLGMQTLRHSDLLIKT